MECQSLPAHRLSLIAVTERHTLVFSIFLIFLGPRPVILTNVHRDRAFLHYGIFFQILIALEELSPLLKLGVTEHRGMKNSYRIIEFQASSTPLFPLEIGPSTSLPLPGLF